MRAVRTGGATPTELVLDIKVEAVDVAGVLVGAQVKRTRDALALILVLPRAKSLDEDLAKGDAIVDARDAVVVHRRVVPPADGQEDLLALRTAVGDVLLDRDAVADEVRLGGAVVVVRLGTAVGGKVDTGIFPGRVVLRRQVHKREGHVINRVRLAVRPEPVGGVAILALHAVLADPSAYTLMRPTANPPSRR